MRFALAPVYLLVALLPWSLAQAQEVDAPPLTLQPSPLLQESIDPQVRSSLPSFVSGLHIDGRPDLETVVQGQAMLRKGDIVIKADRLEYNQPTDLAKARGNVRVNRAGNVYEGPLLELKVDAFEGFFNQPTYHFLRNDAHGQADRVDFVDEQRAVIHNATFTTCKRLPGPSWLPDWILRASTISLDYDEDVGTAEGAVLSFKGVPLLPVPYVTFPLSDQRKSGLLPPTLGVDTVNGTELSVPYYWNIAPNRDATLTPTVMTKRGLSLDSEFRYLESSYAGTAHLNWMPDDKLRDSNRWSFNLNHQAQIPSAWTNDGLALHLKLNRASDDNYWRDFTQNNTTTSTTSDTTTNLNGSSVVDTTVQRLLANDATLTWHNGAWASSVRALKWQTLQDPLAPIVPPYDRVPQVSTTYSRTNLAGFDLSFTADFTQFQADVARTGQVNGKRSYALVQSSYPVNLPSGFLRPKLQLHTTTYQFDSPLSSGANSATRVVPTFSMDSGLVFERDMSLFGRNLQQTLEPRAFYVNTPYRNQNLLPNYDSGLLDFNLATIYTENAFVGNDRISDSNLLTFGVTSRILDSANGIEAAQIGIAQRLRLRNQNVTLPGGSAVQDRLSDLLLGTSVHWDPLWSFEGNVQFTPKTNDSVRSTLGARYRSGSFKTLNAAYRFQRNVSELIDLSWQWPLNAPNTSDQALNLTLPPSQRWYSVGRLNYSIKESRLVNALLGFEYDAGCWLGRVVMERIQTSTSSATQRIMFQLEFVGFSRLGVNPIKSLQTNIPFYQNLRDPSGASSRFSNYD